jgi:hypothetical protein
MKEEKVTITAPNFKVAVFEIAGTSPLVMNKFSAKARGDIRAKQEAGSQAKKGKKREPKDFDGLYKAAMHVSDGGWIGMPAAAFRAALISACRLVDYKMTIAKLALFVEADGYDADERTPLVRIYGKPRPIEMFVRLETGTTDIRVRPIFDEWNARLRVRFDADRFSEKDVANLLMRAGVQVGVGEGRPDSRKSAGMGWGLFEIASEKPRRKAG